MSLPLSSRPSFQGGYAKSAAESAYPELWDKLIGAFPGFDSRKTRIGNVATVMGDAIGTATVNADGTRSYNGTSDYYRIENLWPDSRSSLTLFAMAKTSASGSVDRIISNYPGTSPVDHFSVYQDASGKWGFFIRSANNASISLVSSGAFNDGKWHSVVASYFQQNKAAFLYIDNVLVASNSNAGITGDFSSTNGVCIGADQDGTGFFWAGDIGNVFIWERALLAPEITLLHVDSNSLFQRRMSFPLSIQTAAAGQYSSIFESTIFGGSIIA